MHGDQSHGYFPSITYVNLDLNVQSVCWEIIHLLLICDFCYIQNVIIPKGDNIWISENDIIWSYGLIDMFRQVIFATRKNLTERELTDIHVCRTKR